VVRRSSQDVVREIGNALTTEPQSIIEISEETEAEKRSVGRWLNILHEAGLVEYRDGGNTKLYSKPDEVRLEVVENGDGDESE